MCVLTQPFSSPSLRFTQPLLCHSHHHCHHHTTPHPPQLPPLPPSLLHHNNSYTSPPLPTIPPLQIPDATTPLHSHNHRHHQHSHYHSTATATATTLISIPPSPPLPSPPQTTTPSSSHLVNIVYILFINIIYFSFIDLIFAFQYECIKEKVGKSVNLILQLLVHIKQLIFQCWKFSAYQQLISLTNSAFNFQLSALSNSTFVSHSIEL